MGNCIRNIKEEICPDSRNYSFASQEMGLISEMDTSRMSDSFYEEGTSIETPTLGQDRFKFIKVLGEGTFGKVFLAKMTETDDKYAVKVIKKENITDFNEANNYFTEKAILTRIDSPFVIKLKFSFRQEDQIFLGTEFCPGGDLHFHLKYKGKFSEEDVRFYATEILLALEDLHKFNIIYRDLKPENVLVDENGHIRLTDFGLSKWVSPADNYRAFTICGTNEYLAPEVSLGVGYCKTVDWWSFGVLTYELLTGKLPFNKDKMLFTETFNSKVDFPSYMSKEAVSLISSLLEQNPKNRLGYGPIDSREIKEHPFFKGVDWYAAKVKLIEPPLVPTEDEAEDLSFFDWCTTNKRVSSQNSELF